MKPRLARSGADRNPSAAFSHGHFLHTRLRCCTHWNFIPTPLYNLCSLNTRCVHPTGQAGGQRRRQSTSRAAEQAPLRPGGIPQGHVINIRLRHCCWLRPWLMWSSLVSPAPQQLTHPLGSLLGQQLRKLQQHSCGPAAAGRVQHIRALESRRLLASNAVEVPTFTTHPICSGSACCVAW